MPQSDFRAWPRTRQAGVCLHVTSLPGRYGIGEIGAAAHAFIDTLAAMQIGVWQFLPLGPTGFGDSPYQTLSSFAGNELLIDVADLVRDGLLSEREIEVLAGLPQDAVDFARVVPARTAVVELAATRFSERANANLKSEFDRFRDDNDCRWLRDYALFRTLKRKHGEQPWIAWETPFRFHDNAQLRKFAARAGRRIENVAVSQFLFYRQWRALQAHARKRGVRLFGDLPIYLASDSADVWANRELLCLDAAGLPLDVAGVPPDYFSATGQLWGNPLYDWKRHAADNFAWWIARIRHAMSLADLVRVDHFRAFQSYWAVPQGAATAEKGAWLQGPGADLLDAVDKSVGCRSLVAEDLGIITAEVHTLRERFGIPGMKVLQFEVDRDDFQAHDIDENCVCYTGTHDSDTTAGWYRGDPHDRRSRKDINRIRARARKASGGRAGSMHIAMTRLAFATDARIAIAPMQDLLGLGSEARLNRPGAAEGNWRWRLLPGQVSSRLVNRVRRMVDVAGRCAN